MRELARKLGESSSLFSFAVVIQKSSNSRRTYVTVVIWKSNKSRRTFTLCAFNYVDTPCIWHHHVVLPSVGWVGWGGLFHKDTNDHALFCVCVQSGKGGFDLYRLLP